MATRTNTKLMAPQARVAQLEQEPVGEPGPREILIRNHYTLMNMVTEMCFFGEFPKGCFYERVVRFPAWTGWGCLGTVVAVGEAVTEFATGDRVVGDGHHGTYYLAPVDDPEGPVHVPAGITDDQASLWSMSRVAMLGIRKARIEVGEAVVVIGQGIVGQLTLRFARANGACPLYAVDPAPLRLELSRRVPSATALQGRLQDLSAEIVRLNKGRKTDCVIEATGFAAIIPEAAKLARPGGRLILLGSTRGSCEMDFREAVHGGVDIIGAHWSLYPPLETPMTPWTFRRNGQVYFALLQAGLVNVDGLISHTFNWRDAPDAYQQILQDRTRFMAVRFDWSDCPD